MHNDYFEDLVIQSKEKPKIQYICASCGSEYCHTSSIRTPTTSLTSVMGIDSHVLNYTACAECGYVDFYHQIPKELNYENPKKSSVILNYFRFLLNKAKPKAEVEKKTFQCRKCASSEYVLGDNYSSRMSASAFWELDINRLTNLTCSNCSFTEFYVLEKSLVSSKYYPSCDDEPGQGSLKYNCQKCDFGGYGMTEKHVAGGEVSALLNVETKIYTQLTCDKCTFSEFYMRDKSNITKILDLGANIMNVLPI